MDHNNGEFIGLRQTDARKSKVTDTSYYHDNEQHEPYYCHQEISVQRITSDASTILLMYFPPYMSSMNHTLLSLPNLIPNHMLFTR
jgi:hypothetical protein